MTRQKLEDEILEQARLLGISAEKELALLAANEELKRKVQRLEYEIKQLLQLKDKS